MNNEEIQAALPDEKNVTTEDHASENTIEEEDGIWRKVSSDTLYTPANEEISHRDKDGNITYMQPGAHNQTQNWEHILNAVTPLSSKRGYSIFQNILNESPEDQKRDDLFIKLQLNAAGGVVAAGSAGAMGSLLNPIEGAFLAAVGTLNGARNYLWPKIAHATPQNMAQFASTCASLKVRALTTCANTLDYVDIFHEKSEVAKKLRQKAHVTHRKYRAIQKVVAEKHVHPIAQDISSTRISAYFLGAAVPIHFPQIYLGATQALDKIQENNLNLAESIGAFATNGHFTGATIVAVSYGLFAAHRFKEIPRLQEAMTKFPLIKASEWNNEARHSEIGYLARGEGIKQTLFIAVPMSGFIAKGGAYMYESLHMYEQSFEHIPAFEKAVEFSASGALEYLSQLNMSDAYNLTASTAFMVAGALFAGSGVYEFVESFKEPTKHSYNKYIKQPCQQAYKALNFAEHARIKAAETQRIQEENHQTVLRTLTPNRNALNTKFNHHRSLNNHKEGQMSLKELLDDFDQFTDVKGAPQI